MMCVGACVVDVCGGLVCLLHAHQMCVVRVKLLCVCKHGAIVLLVANAWRVCLYAA